MSGMSWIFVGLLVFFVVAAGFTALIAPMRKNNIVGSSKPVVRAVIGARFDQTDEGVIIESTSVPNGPADKAGLIGGDIILTFDGQKVDTDDRLEELLTTNPGKTVDVEYLRDGQKKTTKLTTGSQDDERRLMREFERRPEGRTQFGYDDGEAERVKLPGMTTYGVKLGTILNSRPADIAGIKNNDIVIEFDGVPIRTSDEFLMRVRRAIPYSTVKLVVLRGPEKPEASEGEEPQHDEPVADKEPKQPGPPVALQKLEIPVKLGKQ